MPEIQLTEANLSAIQQWSNTPCGSSSSDHDRHTLEYFTEVERSRYNEYAPWMRPFFRYDSYAGANVLEVGVGQGTDLVQFARAGARVTGIDITQRHLDLARRNFEVRGLSGTFQLANAASMPFADEIFDVVYSFGVLHHTDQTVRCISECYRVLKPGGTLLIGLYHKYSFDHFKLLLSGLLKGKLWKLGYRGLLSTVEVGANGTTIKPLVKTYSGTQLRNLLEDFKSVDISFRHLAIHLPGFWIPRAATEWFGRFAGWYVIGRAVK